MITLGAAVSAFGCALACAVGASRLLFALARDGVLPTGLAEVSPRRGTPDRATAAVVLAMAVIALVDGRCSAPQPFDVFIWSGTIGTLILIVVYVLATVGAVRLLFFSGPPRVNRAEIVIPVLAAAGARLHALAQRLPYPRRAGGLVPGGVRRSGSCWPCCSCWPGRRWRAAPGERLTIESGLTGADPVRPSERS